MNRILFHRNTNPFSARIARNSAQSSRAEFNWRVSGVIGAVILAVVVAFFGAAKTSHASRTVISGVDCLVEPSMVVELGAAVPGQLAQVNFDRSDYVSSGTVMASLESSVESTVLEIARKSVRSMAIAPCGAMKNC